MNPRFFRIVELDAKFPEDWKLEVSVYDRSIVAFADALIGSTTIDLENRLHSNLLYLNKKSLIIKGKELEEKKKKITKRKDKEGRNDPKLKRKLEKVIKQVKDEEKERVKQEKRTNAIE